MDVASADLIEDDGPEHRVFVVRNDVRRRLDVYLQGRLKGISRSRVQKLIEMGGVKVNGHEPKSSTTIRSGDRINVILPPPAIRVIEPEPIAMDVVYEDEWFIVINKQADLIVHPARSQLKGTMVNGLAHYFKQQCEKEGQTWNTWETRGFKKPRGESGSSQSAEPDQNLRPGIIHRLDKHTTGVIVVAKNDDAHWDIARQFEDRSTLKAYLALVHGGPDNMGGVIDQPIGKHPTMREPYAVRHDSSGKASVTIYRVRQRFHGFTLLELELKTGRTHQIRVHLSYMGWPVVGDIFYGGEAIGESDLDNPPIAAGTKSHLSFARDRETGQRLEQQAGARDDLIMARPALHAALLGFTHPITRRPVKFTAPMHEPMRSLIRKLQRRPSVEAAVARDGVHVELDAVIGTAS